MSNQISALRVVRAGLGLSLVGLLSACSGTTVTNVAPGGQGGNAAAGGTSAIGGTAATTGGATAVNTGSQVNTGGSVAQGGATAAGGSVSTGGVSVTTTGGAAPTGGAISAGGSKATGGSVTTGGSVAAGGTKASGGSSASGGTKATGGGVATGGTKATGGAAPTGGAAATGGISAGGGSSSSDAATTISNWLNNKTCIPYGNPTGQTRTDIINAIIGACEQFGPPPASNPGWKMEDCWAHLTGAVLKESSYNVTSINEAGSDPTVGLTQIRFSSTVCDFYTNGPRARLEAMGCTFPSDFAAHASEQCSSTFWKTTGGDAAHTQWMETPACNIGLGAWYYYTYATGGGDATTTEYLYQLCNGKAQDADLATGLLSHLRGPSNQWANITSASAIPSVGTDYYNAISKVMDCELGAPNGTNAIFIKLTFNKAQYCK